MTSITWLGGVLLCAAAVSGAGAPKVRIESANIRVEFDSVLHSRIVAEFAGKETPLGDFGAAEFVTAGGSDIQDFKETRHKQEDVREGQGHGRRLSISGVGGGLEKTVVVTIYDENSADGAVSGSLYEQGTRAPAHLRLDESFLLH